MGHFRYRAVSPDGRVLEDTLSAQSRGEALRQIRHLNLLALDVTAEKIGRKRPQPARPGKVKTSELLHFTKQIQTLMKAGIPLVQGLDVLREQSSEPSMRLVLEEITAQIKQGRAFSDCLAQYPRVFPPMFLNAVRVGEMSGTLDDALLNIAAYIEEEEAVRTRVKRAIRYPAIVFVTMIAAFILFVTYVIPKFIPLFEMNEKGLPLPTRLLLGTSDFFVAYGWILALSVLPLFFLYRLSQRTKRGRLLRDRLALRIPYFGAMLRKVCIARFAKIFHTMSRSGIPVLTSLEIMQSAMGNRIYEREIKHITTRIQQGESIAHSLEQSPLFTSFVSEMAMVGEQSGALDEMMHSVAAYYDLEVGEQLQKITSSIEPVVTLLLGLLAVVMALAIFLPLWDLMSIGI